MDFNSFNCPGNLMIANDGKSHPFIGTNYYIVMFKEILTEEKILNFVNSVDTTILLPKSGGNPLGVLTSDGRPCITTPTQDPTPGKKGAPPEPNYDGTGNNNKDKNGNASNNSSSSSNSSSNSNNNGSVSKNAN